VLVPAVNAELFVGQNAVSGTNPVPISATTAANASGNPIYVDVTNTVPVTLASTTITGTVAVTQSTSPWVVSGTVALSGTSVVAGNLTNNNAAPVANNLGVLGFIAETAYATVTYTTGDQVLAVTDLHGAVNVDWQALAGTALGAGTTWGTAPTGENVQGVNAELFVGTNAVSATAPVPISATAAANTSGNPIFTSTAVTGTVAVTQSTSPWVVSLTSTTITGTVAVTQSGTWTVQQGGAPWTFTGTLTNNNAAPAANNVGALVAIAESAYTNLGYTTGDQVLIATDLHGAVMSDLEAVAGVALGATGVTAFGTAPAAVNVPGVNASLFSGTTALTNTGGALNVNISGGTVTATIATPTDWGTAPSTSTLVPAVNAESFIGQTALAAVSNYGTAPAAVSAQGVNAYITNIPAVTQSGGPWTQNITQWASTNLGIPTSWGTAPTGAVIGVNAELFSGTTPLTNTGGSLNVDVTNTVPVTLASTTITGTVAVTQSTSPWVVSLASTTITGTVAVDGALTNNNAAPTATLLGVLGAIAETAYNTVTYTTGDMVLPVTDLHGALNQDLQAVAGVQLGATAVTAFGTAPAAVNVPGVNASLFAGTTALTQTGGALNVNVTGFSGGNLSNNTAAPAANNEGSLTAIAATSYTTQTYTNGNQVLLVTDLHGAINDDLQAVGGVQLVAAVSAYGTAPTGTAVMGVNAYITNTVTVAGNRGNNTAVPGTANIGALVSITAPSNTTFPTYVAGNESLLVTDLSGNLNTDVQYWGGTDLGAPSAYGTSPGAVIVPGVNAFVTNTVATTNAASTTGGFTAASGSIGATKTAIKTTAGQVYGWYFYNSNTTVSYVQFFNASVASVTLGTTAPFMSFGIPPVAGANVMAALGIEFGTAITIAITTTRAGATGPTNTVDYNVFYD
jgi:hypothetical protein